VAVAQHLGPEDCLARTCVVKGAHLFAWSVQLAMPRSFRSLRRPVRLVALGFAAATAGAWLFGLVRFVGATGQFEARLPRRLAPPAGEHNLAAQQYGPLLRASSYNRNPVSYHHPWFLVDGRAQPQLIEKWASAPRDRSPWVEIRWREPRQLDRVVLRHAGGLEGDHLTLRNYTLTCLREGGPPVTLQVRDNHARLASHPLACAGARGVRLDAQLPAATDIVRLYELEAFGQ
jgi:hypothetical protein